MNQINNKKLTTTSILCELSRLKSQQFYLENTQSHLLIDFDSEHDVKEKELLISIKKLQSEMKKDFKEFQLERKCNLEEILDDINTFKVNMMTQENIQKCNNMQYREAILEIDNKLTNISDLCEKTHMELAEEYIKLSSTIPSMTDLMIEIPKYVPKSIRVNVIAKPIDESLANDVRVFDNFLQNSGGHTGGWSGEIHTIFLKYKCKYKTNIKRIIECIQTLLPGNNLPYVLFL